MNYCTKGEWVVIPRTGQIGTVARILNRRDHQRDGRVIVQCGNAGPFVEADMAELREPTGKEYKIATGLIYHED